MLSALDIINIYISFFEKRKHKRIPNSPLVPENDPTTLFTSSGMQPLVPYLLGEPHPQGKRLVNAQNSFRAQDIDEIGDNRHTTFFRMLGNWSLGDYFKSEQLPWIFEFLTGELKIPAEKLYISVFKGFENIPKDNESEDIWKTIFTNAGVNPEGRIFSYGVDKNWWSKSGEPKNMPNGEPGGPDSEIFYDFGAELNIHEKSEYKNDKCHINCNCGRYLEIGNSVFMEYKKTEKGFEPLPQKNVDFGGGLERLLAAVENQPDIFQTNLFLPIIQAVEQETKKDYRKNSSPMRIITDHFVASVFISANKVHPSNKEQGYILRRLIRRGLDNYYKLEGKEITPVIESIVDKYKETDNYLVDKFEEIKLTILEEEKNYKRTLGEAKKFITKKYQSNGELMGVSEISSDDAFILYSTHGLSPTQIKSLGFTFDEQKFAEKMEEHQKLSRAGAAKKFSGGLADHSEKTIKGHTATHLLHQALKDVLGNKIRQAGSNITSERVRFDFHFDRKLTDDELKKVEEIVNAKIKENLPVNFKIMDADEAKKIGATGLFEEKYTDKVKVYFIGPPYSAEFCGGPHVNFTGELKRFNIIKQENLGKENKRIYARLDD
ncbi:MAG: alanine--tRNA ligase [bacterium]|nr:alanine--tRNA ligase [bacterium]